MKGCGTSATGVSIGITVGAEGGGTTVNTDGTEVGGTKSSTTVCDAYNGGDRTGGTKKVGIATGCFLSAAGVSCGPGPVVGVVVVVDGVVDVVDAVGVVGVDAVGVDVSAAAGEIFAVVLATTGPQQETGSA